MNRPVQLSTLKLLTQRKPKSLQRKYGERLARAAHRLMRLSWFQLSHATTNPVGEAAQDGLPSKVC